MASFRTSLSARLFSAAAASALLGAGLVPILGLPGNMLALALLLPIALGCASIITGVSDYTPQMVLLTALSPVLFFIHACLAFLVVQKFQGYAWALIAGSALPLGFLVASFGVRDEPIAATIQTRHA